MSDLNRFCTGNGAANFFGNSVSASWCTGEYTGTYSTSANEDVLLADAETLLPESGGTIDASTVTGQKTWTPGSTLRVTKPTHLILNGKISYTGAPLEHGLIWIDYTAAGTEINGVNRGVVPIQPAHRNQRMNPPDLLSRWNSYILTSPSRPLSSCSITSTSRDDVTVTVKCNTTVPFTVGQNMRISGAPVAADNGYFTVQTVNANHFTIKGLGGGSHSGSAAAYMPVIQGWFTGNLYIHNLNFLLNQNTGDGIWSTETAAGFPATNSAFDCNQFFQSDGIGNQGFAIDVSNPQSAGGLNFNNLEIKMNYMGGMAGAIRVSAYMLVAAEIKNNGIYFGINNPQIQLGDLKTSNIEALDYSFNAVYGVWSPANSHVMEVNTGYNLILNGNHWELTNLDNNPGVIDLYWYQGNGEIVNSSFLTDREQYGIYIGSTASYSTLLVRGSHVSPSAGFTFFNDPICERCPFAGNLIYEANDLDTVAAGSFVEPATYQLTGTNAENYSNNTDNWIPIDSTNLSKEVTVPQGSKLDITVTLTASNSVVDSYDVFGLFDTYGAPTELGSKMAQQVHVIDGYYSVTLHYVLVGDGHQHRITPEFYAQSGSTAKVWNSGGHYPIMTLKLEPMK